MYIYRQLDRHFIFHAKQLPTLPLPHDKQPFNLPPGGKGGEGGTRMSRFDRHRSMFRCHLKAMWLVVLSIFISFLSVPLKASSQGLGFCFLPQIIHFHCCLSGACLNCSHFRNLPCRSGTIYPCFQRLAFTATGVEFHYAKRNPFHPFLLGMFFFQVVKFAKTGKKAFVQCYDYRTLRGGVCRRYLMARGAFLEDVGLS